MIIEIKGTPKAQPRQKFWAKATNSGEVVSGNYDPGTADAWRQVVSVELARYAPIDSYTGPVMLSLDFFMPRPKAHYRTKGGKPSNVLKPNAPFYHIKKPDRDNLEKLIMDELKRHGYYKDDGQVCAGPVTKVYGLHFVGCMICFEDWSYNETDKVKHRELTQARQSA